MRCVYLIAAGAAAFAMAMMGAAGPAAAACTPMTDFGATPPAGTIVTCTGMVNNQNTSNGYGTATENNLTINVNPVSVTGGLVSR